ncbi:Kazal-type serine protease inhibitor domain-containing protein [Kumtagia ephedrae]|uniref:Kazal-like domain-containing protein n=1 Tax=Kumtagia ephedrae TaxID=2116701 RepID=A0A2P7SDN6_9HYPH|nr:Kazal-type serine protease inhibitor domain-containing protein [Mesorhizobium ephedrae]PSJ60583.1 hypothetical protein C7I84_11460 [Mesorhizobium ephedrae]
MLSTIWSRCAMLFAVLAVLTSCTVVVDEPGPGPRPIPDDRFCTQQYDPVCARRGDNRRTFANACMADAAGYRVIRRGECGRGSDEPRACTREYRPVCARRGGDRQTFNNPCLAEQAGYRVLGDGECRRGGGGGDDDGDRPRFCTREYAPVCARRGGDRRTFPNACEARSADYRILGEGPC